MRVGGLGALGLGAYVGLPSLLFVVLLTLLSLVPSFFHSLVLFCIFFPLVPRTYSAKVFDLPCHVRTRRARLLCVHDLCSWIHLWPLVLERFCFCLKDEQPCHAKIRKLFGFWNCVRDRPVPSRVGLRSGGTIARAGCARLVFRPKW